MKGGAIDYCTFTCNRCGSSMRFKDVWGHYCPHAQPCEPGVKCKDCRLWRKARREAKRREKARRPE